MQDPPETLELLTFVRAVEAGSLSRAALELGVPRPTASRRLARLERKLGVRLLRRTTRTMQLTEAGEVFHAHARAVLEDLQRAEASVRAAPGVVRGLLRVSTPPIPGASFGAFVSEFMGRHPEVRIEHDASARHVDLERGTFDVAVRAGLAFPPGLVARNVTRTRVLAVASPTYLDARGRPRRVTDLARHRCLAGLALGEHRVTHWPLFRGGRVTVEPVLATNDVLVLRETAIAGVGIALVPELLVRDDVAAGRLVPVLPERLGAPSQVAVLYPERELQPAHVRLFVEGLVTWARAQAVFRAR